jgi:stalled ribosome rescue protein Dom34
MQSHFHAIVWIDHHEAKVFHFNADKVDRAVVRPHDRMVHLHTKTHTIGNGHAPVDKDFLGRVAEALAGAGTILIVGPAGAKTELANHLAAHAPELSARVAGVEAVDHPSDGELVALARRFFHASDRMHPPA